MKRIEPADALRIINSGPTVLVSCGPVDKPNAVTVAWNMVVSKNPPLVAIALAHQRYSLGLIRDGGCFVVNVPGADQLKAVMYCGTKSGKDGDKFAPAGLTAVAVSSVPTIAVAECPAWLECKVHKEIVAGDHVVVFGEVVDAYADEDCFDSFWKLETEHGQPLHHLGGQFFCSPSGRFKA